MFYFVSDLHLEFDISYRDLIDSFPSSHFLIVSGDITVISKDNGKSLRNFLTYAKTKFPQVIFIAGNHEFYGSEFNYDNVINIIKNISIETNTHFLHREKKIIDNIEFIGCTLWSRIKPEARFLISDFRAKVFKNTDNYIEAFNQDFIFLKKSLEEKTDKTRIVLTHHLPTFSLINKRFHNSSSINTAFYTEILNDLNFSQVKYWACGHTHEFSKLQINNTTFICNPIGYKNEFRITRPSFEIYN